VDDSKVRVIHNGVSEEFIFLGDSGASFADEFKELSKYEYMLFVGDRSGYKNFDLAVEALKNFRELKLVLIGGQELSEAEKTLIGNNIVRVKQYRGMGINKLNLLYNNAFCLLYPSSYEGFGIPVAEAMRAGCPTVCLNASSIPEVAGDGALMIEKAEKTEVLTALMKLRDETFRASLIHKGLQQAKKISWDKCFAETYSFYQEIAEKKFS
jgi:mannosyltransferase